MIDPFVDCFMLVDVLPDHLLIATNSGNVIALDPGMLACMFFPFAHILEKYETHFFL
jgi:hypothetical protein